MVAESARICARTRERTSVPVWTCSGAHARNGVNARARERARGRCARARARSRSALHIGLPLRTTAGHFLRMRRRVPRTRGADPAAGVTRRAGL